MDDLIFFSLVMRSLGMALSYDYGLALHSCGNNG